MIVWRLRIDRIVGADFQSALHILTIVRRILQCRLRRGQGGLKIRPYNYCQTDFMLNDNLQDYLAA